VQPSTDASLDSPDGASEKLRRAGDTRAREQAIKVQLYALTEARRDGREIDEALFRSLEAERMKALGSVIESYTLAVDDPDLAHSSRRPHALLTLATALRERGDDDVARTRYRELVRGYPAVPEAAQAYLAIAEIAFAHENLREAMEACDRALVAPYVRDDTRISLLYMQSWILRGLGEKAEPKALFRAMEALRQVIALSERAHGRAAAVEQSAQGELVELYAQYGDPSEAAAFFGALREPLAGRLLAALRERLKATVTTTRSL
jgi:tetratricopeptide (TPR) repeat protein